MISNPVPVTRRLLLVVLASLLYLISIGIAPPAVIATADPAFGPVPPGSVPGGVAVVDSDPGNSGLWGRSIGRTITYTVTNPALFDYIAWGVVSGFSPGAGFTGSANPLAFDLANSNLPGGIARWTGNRTYSTVFGSVISRALHDDRHWSRGPSLWYLFLAA